MLKYVICMIKMEAVNNSSLKDTGMTSLTALGHTCCEHKSSSGTYGVYFTKHHSILRRRLAARSIDCTKVILDILRRPVKFRSYLKFYGARTAFGRVIEGKIGLDTVNCLKSAMNFWKYLTNRPVPVLAHLCKIWRAPYGALFICQNGDRYYTIETPTGARTICGHTRWRCYKTPSAQPILKSG